MTISPQRRKLSINCLSCIFCVSSLPVAVIKFLHESNLMEKGLIFGSQFKDTVHHGGEVIVTEFLRLAGHIASTVKSKEP